MILSKRLDITISIAQEMVYLREEYGFPIVHCDLKPAKILMDEDLEAHMSDFGTARKLGIHLQQGSRGSSSSAFQGTIGYFASSKKTCIFIYNLPILLKYVIVKCILWCFCKVCIYGACDSKSRRFQLRHSFDGVVDEQKTHQLKFFV